MALLILIVIGFGFYLVLKVQGLDAQLKRLQVHFLELDDQIRRLHAKIVQQMPGFMESGAAKPATPAAKPAAAPPPVASKRQEIINCPHCFAPMELGSEFCDQCGLPMKTPVTPPAAVPAPEPKPALPPLTNFPEKRRVPEARKPILPKEPAKPRFEMPAIDWEQFMGVKLFAWLGGFALFLGMAFLAKYSLDHGWISPLMRVSFGMLVGVGTIIGALALRPKGYAVTVHTLAASGIAILYADIFASRSLYNFLSTEAAFPAMILVTVAAFFLSVRLNSRYVAILGMVGGFLTPPMLSTGVDHPIALFSYILMLDMGLAAVTIRQRWGFLLGLSSVATFMMEAGWTLKFFTPEKAWLAIGIYITFGLFFLIVSTVADRQGAKDNSFQEPADYMPILSMVWVGYLLRYRELGLHPGVIFTLLFSMLALLGWRAVRRSQSQHAYLLGAVISFILLAVWTVRYMTPGMALLSAGLYLALCLFTFFVSSRVSGSGMARESVEGVANFMPLGVFGLAFYFLTLPTMGEHPLLVFSLLFMLSAMLAWRALYGKGSRIAYGLGIVTGFLLLVSWTATYMKPEGVIMASGIVLGYCLFHLLVSRETARKGIEDDNVHIPADFLPLASMSFVWYMLRFPSLGHRPGIVLSVLLILGGLLAYRALKRPGARVAYGLGGAASFFLLTYWTMLYMRSSLLLWGLGYFMAFALVHTIYPILFQRARPSVKPLLAGFMAPILGLVLILVAMLACDLLSFLLWPFILLLGMLGVALSWLAGSLIAAGGAVLLVMACFGVWLFRLPDPGGLSGVLTMLAVFSCAFFAWTLLVTRGKSLFAGNAFLSKAGSILPEDAAEFPAYVAFMPFMLLMMVCVRLPLVNPTDVFLMALLLDILLLALARFRKMELVVPVALGSTALLEWVWLQRNGPLAQPMLALSWGIGFYMLFMLFPFVFRRHMKGLSAWRASALAGLCQWPMLWAATDRILGKPSMAIVPAFFAIPSLLCLIGVIVEEKDEWRPGHPTGAGAAPSLAASERTGRLSKLAWFGGITLLFVTLIIPIQFDKEWLTVGWTLEGAALLWLSRRVPHEGLRAWGLALLAVCFARLALNSSVFSYHPRSGNPFLNWYLWVYGIAIISYYMTAWFMRDKREFMDVEMPPLLNAAGTILCFLLLNIEIADYFSTGSVITFNFSGNIAQDMAYSLSWAVFAILMLMAGIRKTSKAARYASLTLLLVTIGKVFFHDLWRLGQLFRVASFVGLAISLILVSFLYQKFLGKETKAGGMQ